MTQAPAWLPYCGPGPAPGDWLGRWNLDPWLLAALLAVAAGWTFSGISIRAGIIYYPAFGGVPSLNVHYMKTGL